MKQQAQEPREDSLVIYEEETKVLDPFMLEDQANPAPQQQKSFQTPENYSANEVNKPSPETDEEESNSAMSFNFIYYIIDKFKLADPLD